FCIGREAIAGGRRHRHAACGGSMDDRPLVIAGKTFNSRLILGTGKYRTMEEMVDAFAAADVDMVTVALRRLDLDDPTEKAILDYVDTKRHMILPNTAGCQTADEAIRVAHLARAVALAESPATMGEAIAMGVRAGRLAYLSGRIPKKAYASASSPLEGVVR